MAFQKDSLVKISCGFLWDFANVTALAPVSSAIRSLAEETAGAEAPRSGIIPRAAVTQAIVLAVPITPHVPIYRYLAFSQWIAFEEHIYTYRRRKLLIDC